MLFKQLRQRTLFELDLTTIIQDEFLVVQSLLTGHDYLNFPVGSKMRLVVDEAQVLSDKGSTKFQSSYLETDPRPMLSPVLYGFRKAGSAEELTIIYCGTGLSMKTLHWALSSGDGVKEYGSSIFPYIEFPGWTNADSVQAYVDRLKEQLSDNESRRKVDAFIPSVAVEMLHNRLGGQVQTNCHSYFFCCEFMAKHL
jgi:hypothetical protein